MSSAMEPGHFFDHERGEDVPEVTMEQLQDYLDKNPDEKFQLKDPCGCLLHNYLAFVNANKGEKFIVNKAGVAAKRVGTVTCNVGSGTTSLFQPVAKLPGPVATLFEQYMSKTTNEDWDEVTSGQVKGVLDKLAAGENEDAKELLVEAVDSHPFMDVDDDEWED